MPDPRHFDADPLGYETARPPYPDALWSRLRALGVLRPGLRAVDLGAGTGQATGPLLAAGLSVTAVEPGARLARRLTERFPAADVRVARAEDVELTPTGYDLAVAATSIHWMDLGLVLPRVRAALVPQGRFLVWRNEFGDPTAALTPFRVRVAGIVADRASVPDVRHRAGTTELAEMLTAGGLFVVESVERMRWRIDLDEAQVRGLFATFSDWSEAEVAAAGDAVRVLGGTVREHYVTPLIVLRRA
ncbi:class I SAM-dependent methyltransferase [Occultella glacieicola]|uniref:Class I SAM-dependent methyltransferase n=1 Tax=Occultella glacieicola TaxID=2518684 RepID=A0ABY2EDS8_9MICO|nr:class I SAM-dependent methyltransferase [Occultella glacieicola]